MGSKYHKKPMLYKDGMAKQAHDPEWADEKWVTRHLGITHSPLFRLRKAGTIRSVSLRPDGASYGKRLYHVPSIREYLAGLEARELQTADEGDR